MNQDGHVFEVSDDGCGMGYTGNKDFPGRLDRFLGLGLSAIVGQKSDEFSWKGLGSKLSYQSKRVEIETYLISVVTDFDFSVLGLPSRQSSEVNILRGQRDTRARLPSC